MIQDMVFSNFLQIKQHGFLRWFRTHVSSNATATLDRSTLLLTFGHHRSLWIYLEYLTDCTMKNETIVRPRKESSM